MKLIKNLFHELPALGQMVILYIVITACLATVIFLIKKLGGSGERPRN